MVTTFNSKDMIGFANHIAQRIKDGLKRTGPNGNYQVSQGEFMAWKDSQAKH